MIRLAAASLLAFALSAPAMADEEVSFDQATSRLRACVINGSAGAPRDSLEVAVAAVRVLCTPQLKRVRRLSDQRVMTENAGADDARLAELRLRAWRQIDFDLARLVPRETGLQP